MTTFHRDRKGLTVGFWVCGAFVGAAGLGVALLLNTDLPGMVKVAMTTILVACALFFALLMAFGLRQRSWPDDCLVVEPERVRCALPMSVGELRRDEVSQIRFAQGRFGRTIGFMVNGQGRRTVEQEPLPKRLLVRFSMWQGYGAISLSPNQIVEDFDHVEATLADLWPDVPRIHA